MLLVQPAPKPLEKLFKIASMSEEGGFDSLWMPDHMLMVPRGFVPAAWNVLSAVAMITKKVQLVTGVTCPHRIHPAVLAQSIATIDHISNGRIALGIGPGEAMNLEPFGIEWDKPVSKMLEFLEITQRLWRGEKFSYDGEFYTMKDAFLQIDPIQKPNPPIYIGANGPRTRRLTGELFDGWQPTWENPEMYRKHLKEVEEGAKKAGRSLDEIDTSMQIYTAVADDYDTAYKRMELYKPVMSAAPGKLAEAYGIEIPEEYSPDFYFRDLLVDRKCEVKLAELAKYVPDRAITELSITGTPDDCKAQIERFMDAGLKHVVLINIGPDPKYVMKAYTEDIIPYFKESTA